MRAVPHGNWLYDLRRFGGRTIGPIFDVGANIGQTAWGLVRYFPDDPIYCFEPVESSFSVLTQNYGHRAKCFKLALGSQAGTADIRTYANSELNTLSDVSDSARLQDGTLETIEIDTLDAFTAREGIATIGLLKMDVQGWEFEVLKGAARLLEARAIRFIFVEVGFDPGDSDMILFGEMHAYLLNRSYIFSGIYDQFRWGPNREYVGFANALYVLAEKTCS